MTTSLHRRLHWAAWVTGVGSFVRSTSRYQGAWKEKYIYYLFQHLVEGSQYRKEAQFSAHRFISPLLSTRYKGMVTGTNSDERRWLPM